MRVIVNLPILYVISCIKQVHELVRIYVHGERIAQLVNDIEPMKHLFICSQNRRRSLTAERIFDGVDGFVARSAGTEDGARIRVTSGHLGWADVIFVMEKRHIDRLRTKFRQELSNKYIICLRVADRYDFTDDTLIRLLETAVRAHLQEYQ